MALPPQLVPVPQDAALEPVLEPDELEEAELVTAGIETEAEVTEEVELEMATEVDVALAKVIGAVEDPVAATAELLDEMLHTGTVSLVLS